jgi:hypothetical protein
LNFTAAMKGRLALPTGLSDLNNLRGQARTAARAAHQIQLTEDSRGKVVIGDTTFLFQFVRRLPIQPRPQLARVRHPRRRLRGLADDRDRGLLVSGALLRDRIDLLGLVGSRRRLRRERERAGRSR